MILVEVNDEEFQSWVKRTKDAFRYMIKTMIKVAKVVNEHTLPLTPFETGKLGRSFQWRVLTSNSKQQVVQLRMSALNERTGYDYALIQHENMAYNHYKEINTGEDSFVSFQGRDHYLKWGLYESREDAFMLIEDDYASLFSMGVVL